MHFSSSAAQSRNWTYFHSSPIVGEGIYRASEKQPEMWGAAEVQEDEDTRVEVPLDQVLFKI